MGGCVFTPLLGKTSPVTQREKLSAFGFKEAAVFVVISMRSLFAGTSLPWRLLLQQSFNSHLASSVRKVYPPNLYLSVPF